MVVFLSFILPVRYRELITRTVGLLIATYHATVQRVARSESTKTAMDDSGSQSSGEVSQHSYLSPKSSSLCARINSPVICGEDAATGTMRWHRDSHSKDVLPTSFCETLVCVSVEQLEPRSIQLQRPLDRSITTTLSEQWCVVLHSIRTRFHSNKLQRQQTWPATTTGASLMKPAVSWSNSHLTSLPFRTTVGKKRFH